MALTVGVATDVGRVRDHNEDTAMAARPVFVVADGMGGHAAGEVASRIAADAMGELAGRDRLRAEDVVSQLELANQRIRSSAGRHPEQTGMGTTVAGLAVVTSDGSDHWAVFNVGDSRVYCYLDGVLTLMTVDHSHVRELFDMGAITEADMARHPLRNVITRSLGTAPMGDPDVWVFPPQPGEQFLICSDGLSNELSSGQIRDIIEANRTAQATADALVRAAVTAGGHDNVTAIVVGLDRGNADSGADADTASP
jgi:PPM family protein phosphatase